MLRLALPLCVCLACSTAPTRLDDVDTSFHSVMPAVGMNPHYVATRPPLAPSPLRKLPPGAVRPAGWLRAQLERQAAGFVGHLGEISSFLRKEDNAWLSADGEGHSPWEEVPYWLKGYGDLGYVLDDAEIIAEAQVWIEGILASQTDDGWFGPRSNRTRIATDRGGMPDVWPNMIALNVLQSWHEYRGDPRVLECMARYFRWQLSVPDEDFLLPFWQQQRGADNLASVYWLYDRTGEPWLLELAEKIHRRTADWTGGVANWHGVNTAQAFRGPATFGRQSGDPGHLAATESDLATVMASYGQVPGGMWAADENARPGYAGPRQAAETCTMVELMLSCEMLGAWTGDPKWADLCEEVAFNSFPASMTADLKALRYLTAPNMIRSDSASKAPGLQNSGPMLRFDPWDHRCCQHNVSHGWPYFTEHLWMATADEGVAAVLHAPSRAVVTVRGGARVALRSDSDYPFTDSVDVTIETAADVRFPLYLRVPAWCAAPRLAVNGTEVAVVGTGPGFVRVERTWRNGDEVRLHLPMAIEVQRWPANHDAVSVRRGPLVYSLLVPERVETVGGTEAWPAYEIHPAGDWNFGLELDAADPASSFRVERGPMPPSGQPFALDEVPLRLTTHGRRIPAWREDPLGLVGALQPSPVRTDEPHQELTLIPMGAARLRITCFPVVGTGEDAHHWIAPRDPLPATASHCWQGDTVAALSDGLVPRSSDDHSVPRFTFWPRKGSAEWVEYRFDEPRELSTVAVYWFDDGPAGGCRVPAGWTMQYEDGEGKWRDVATATPGGVAKDDFNRVDFAPLRTAGLRLQVQLRDGFSAGVLEWSIE